MGAFHPRWDQWRQEGASPTLLHWIHLGVPLPLWQLPALHTLHNHHLKPLKEEFMEGKINRLLKEQALRELLPHEEAHISPIGVVPKKNGKFQLIINMRLLNLYLWPPKFKYNGLKDLTKLLQVGDFLFTLNFHNSFHHMEVKRRFQPLLGLQWRNQQFTFRVFPFSLNASPWAFTRFVKFTANALVSKGIQCLAYMDNIIVMAPSWPAALQAHETTLNLLRDLSWSVNWEKSSLKPSQSKEFLGLTVDTSAEPRFRVPAAKSHALRHDISRLIHAARSHGSVPVCRAAAVAGHCVSLARAVLPARLLLRNLYRDISRRTGWNSQIRLSEEAIHDLEEWRAGLLKWDGHVASIRPADVVLETDTSLSGWGAALKGSSVTSASWWKKRGQHINKLELKAILQALRSLAPVLRNRSVLVHCDNVTAVAYVNHLGGRSTAMNRTTRKIFDLCQRLTIQISAAHLPGEQNGRADRLSRLFPQHEWSIAPRLFNSLNQMWGPHSVDRMATARNAILPRFNSRFWEVGSEAVDATRQDWRGENNWVVPPIALLPKIVRLLERQGATATVIAPLWQGRQWCQDLLRLTTEPPVPIPNTPESFSWTGDLPEPLRNHRLQDLWSHRTEGWSPAALAALDLALAPSTWRRYRSSLVRFRDFCWENDVPFPPEASQATATIANFIEAVTRASQRPSSTINSLLAAISTLYEPLDMHPTRDPLIGRLRKALVRSRTKRPIDHGQVFDLSNLADLFRRWGTDTNISRTRSKLLALLCTLGALRVSAAILPRFDDISVVTVGDRRCLVVPVVGYKNDTFGEGNTVRLFACSEPTLCPVTTWERWVRLSASIRRHLREPRIVFELAPPHAALSPDRCAAILKAVAGSAGLDPSIYTARTFRKSGVMAGIHAGVEPDAIFRLGGWRDPNTFWKHYVVREIPSTFTDILFDVDGDSSAPEDAADTSDDDELY